MCDDTVGKKKKKKYTQIGKKQERKNKNKNNPDLINLRRMQMTKLHRSPLRDFLKTPGLKAIGMPWAASAPHKPKLKIPLPMQTKLYKDCSKAISDMSPTNPQT